MNKSSKSIIGSVAKILKCVNSILPEQSVWFLEAIYKLVYPPGQDLHSCFPVSSWYVPMGHRIHKPSAQYVPVGQAAINWNIYLLSFNTVVESTNIL